MEESNRRMGRPWVRPWMERRVGQGAFTLVGQLRVEDPCSFRNYQWMSDALFDELCGLVAPAIKRNDTKGQEEFIYWALSGCLVNNGVTS